MTITIPPKRVRDSLKTPLAEVSDPFIGVPLTEQELVRLQRLASRQARANGLHASVGQEYQRLADYLGTHLP